MCRVHWSGIAGRPFAIRWHDRSGCSACHRSGVEFTRVIDAHPGERGSCGRTSSDRPGRPCESPAGRAAGLMPPSGSTRMLSGAHPLEMLARAVRVRGAHGAIMRTTLDPPTKTPSGCGPAADGRALARSRARARRWCVSAPVRSDSRELDGRLIEDPQRGGASVRLTAISDGRSLILLGVLLFASETSSRSRVRRTAGFAARVGPLAEKVFLLDGSQIAHLPPRAVVKRVRRSFARPGGGWGIRAWVG